MRVSSWLCGRKGNRRFRTVFIPFRRERESGCRRGPRNCGRGFLSIICPYRRSGTSDEQKRLHFGGAFFVISKHRANQIFHKFTFLTWLQQILILGDSSQLRAVSTLWPTFYKLLIPFLSSKSKPLQDFTCKGLEILVGRAGVEPATLCLKGRYSTY